MPPQKCGGICFFQQSTAILRPYRFGRGLDTTEPVRGARTLEVLPPATTFGYKELERA